MQTPNLESLNPEFALQQLEASGLRGRGGGWFPAHRKWRAVLAEGGAPIVVANGGEGEPGSIKDRFIMRTRPGDVIDGIRIAARTLRAERAWIYLKGSFEEEERRLRAAIDARGAKHEISIHRGDDSYVGGEETAILESIEGRKAWPRQKPPRPSASGLFGRPTLIQNVDTLARVPLAVNLGSGYPEKDTLTVSVWGDVERPGAYEVRTSSTLRRVLEEYGGSGSKPVLVFPNGAHALPLGPGSLDVPLDPEGLAQAGSALGLASILVIADEGPKASLVRSIARFFERESCGQCPPCSIGTANLRTLVEGERPATHRLTPQVAIRETTSFMTMHGYCGHSRAGALAVSRLFERFETDVLTRIREGFPATGSEERDPFGPDSKERRALEAFLEAIPSVGQTRALADNRR